MIPRSIRGRLLLSLLLALAAAAALVGGLTYRSVLGQTEALFDYQLRQMALSLRDQGEIAPGNAAALQDEDLDFVVQIWHLDGRSVYASRAHRDLPNRTALGWSEIQTGSERWRSFAVAAHERVIQVAQPVRIREGLAADAALRSLLPLLAAAPLMAALLWWLIERSLRPLARVARQVGDQDAAALAPLPTGGLPDEVAPLVTALNALLDRLAGAWAGQVAFVADAAHELRSPLTALTLQAQVLRRLDESGAAAADRQAALAALVAGVDRASRLVAQLLALARTEPGAPQPPAQPVALAPLLRQVLAESAAPLAASRGSQVSLQADETLQVAGDPAELQVLVRNLVDNALRYSPPGGTVQVIWSDGHHTTDSADAEPDAPDAPDLHGATGPLLTVDDSGPGIPEADRERVFERFVRGASAGSASGSGLGLAIVRAIARRHGARLTLGSSPLGGLRVGLRFKQPA